MTGGMTEDVTEDMTEDMAEGMTECRTVVEETHTQHSSDCLSRESAVSVLLEDKLKAESNAHSAGKYVV